MIGSCPAPAKVSVSKLPWALAWRLAVGQIVSWGILYYAFTVVSGPMREETGWSLAFVNGGLSVGLLAWGLCALPVGAWIQRRGAGRVMTWGSSAGGTALVLMGLAEDPWLYVIAWVLLGAAMAGVLYEPAFAVVTAAFGEEYRRGITMITLLGGLASTVFIPLAQLGVQQLGWRPTLIALGVAQMLICVPLHAVGLPSIRSPDTQRADSPLKRARGWVGELKRDVCDRRFVGLAIWFTAHAAAFTGLIFLVIPALQARGTENPQIMQAIAVIGPSQVLARFFLTARGRRFSALRVGGWALAGLVVAVSMLLASRPTLPVLLVFAVLYGLGNGVMTIVRGTAVAEILGRERYAELSGALSTPAVLAKAAAPLVLAMAWTALADPRAVFVGVLILLLLGAAGLVIVTCAVTGKQAALPRPLLTAQR